jgi:hypothetical protein
VSQSKDAEEMMRRAHEIMTDLVMRVPSLTWESLPAPGDDAKSFRGMGDGWVVTVVSYASGSVRRYDGACVAAFTIVHLTPEVAELVFHHVTEMMKEKTVP